MSVMAHLEPDFLMKAAWHASQDLYEAHKLPIGHTITGTSGHVDIQFIHFYNALTRADVDAFAAALGLTPTVEEDRHTFHCSECDGSQLVYSVRFVFDGVRFRVWGHLRDCKEAAA